MKSFLAVCLLLVSTAFADGLPFPQMKDGDTVGKVAKEPSSGDVKPGEKSEGDDIDPFEPEKAWPRRMSEPSQAAVDEKLRFPIPAEQRKGTGPRLVMGKIRGEQIEMTFLNDSDKTVHLHGSGLGSPFCTPEIFRDGKWIHAPGHMNCGTGARDSILPAGHGFHFQVSLPLAPTPFRLSMSAESETDKTGTREDMEVFSGSIDLLPARIRDADHVVDISVYEEEWSSTPQTKAPNEDGRFSINPEHPEDYPEEYDTEMVDIKWVKRAVVTRVYKGDMKVGDKLEYCTPVIYDPGPVKHFRSGVEGEPRTLLVSADAIKEENGSHVMGKSGHYNFSRVKGVMAAAFAKEVAGNAELDGAGRKQATGFPGSPGGTDWLPDRIAENDFVVDTCVYEREWVPPTKELPKAMYITRSTVTGVHKGDIPVGTRLESSALIEDPPKYIPALRSVVEGELETGFFSKEDAVLKDGKYAIVVGMYGRFDRLEGKSDAFLKELKTNPALRGSYRAADVK